MLLAERSIKELLTRYEYMGIVVTIPDEALEMPGQVFAFFNFLAEKALDAATEKAIATRGINAVPEH